MKRLAVAINWGLLALFGVAFMVVLVRYPGMGGAGTLMLLLPYGSALLAFKSQPNRGIAGIGLLLNSLVVAFCAVGLVLSFTGRVEEPIKATIGAVLFSIPSLLNWILLKWTWDRARAHSRSANERSQATRDTRA